MGSAMLPDPGTITTIVGLAVAGLVWLVRLEGRVNAHDSTISQIRDDLEYIRGRIDSAINGRH
jgi:hypothetical protein